MYSIKYFRGSIVFHNFIAFTTRFQHQLIGRNGLGTIKKLIRKHKNDKIIKYFRHINPQGLCVKAVLQQNQSTWSMTSCSDVTGSGYVCQRRQNWEDIGKITFLGSLN